MVIPELKTWANGECPDVLAFKHVLYPMRVESTVVECKASRSDFLADKAKPFRKTPELGMGVFRWYFAPAGLVKPEELPAGWGLAETSGRGARAVVCPMHQVAHNVDGELRLLVAAMRRVCHPSHAFPPAHFVHEVMGKMLEAGPELRCSMTAEERRAALGYRWHHTFNVAQDRGTGT